MHYLGRIFKVFGNSEKDAITNVAAFLSCLAAITELLISTAFLPLDAHRYAVVMAGFAGIILGSASGKNHQLTGINRDA